MRCDCGGQLQPVSGYFNAVRCLQCHCEVDMDLVLTNQQQQHKHATGSWNK